MSDGIPAKFSIKRLISAALLGIGMAFPALSGLIYGPFAWIWLAFSLFISLLFLTQPNLKFKKWLFSMALFIFLLSSIDIFLNLNRQNKEQKSTLFLDTEIPYLQTYVPDTQATPSLMDCANFPTELYGDSCISFTFSTDAYGFRNPGFNPKDSIDLLILGDSYGVGICQDDETVPANLKKKGFTPYNLSISGTGPWEQVQLLERELPRLTLAKDCKLVWLVFPANDLDSYMGGENQVTPGKFRLLRDAYRLFRFRSPLRFLGMSLFRKMTGKTANPYLEVRNFPDQKSGVFTRIYGERMAREKEAVLAHPNWSALQAQYLKGKGICENYGLEAEVFLIPTKGEVYEWILEGNLPWSFSSHASPTTQLLRNFFAENSIPCHDLRPWLTLRAPAEFQQHGNLLYWHADTHLNATGNKVVAEKIETVLNPD